MIQDIEPHHLDNQYKPVPPDKDSIALYYEDHAALMKVSEKGISFPSFADLEHLNREIYKECIYLFSVDDERYYLVNEIDRSMLLDFQMKNTEIFRTYIRSSSDMQNHGIWHLQELRDSSFIIGIKTGNIADGAENG